MAKPHECDQCERDEDHPEVRYFARRTGLRVEEALRKVKQIASNRCDNSPYRTNPYR